MKIITPGHKYELAYFEVPEQKGQALQFIEKVHVKKGVGIKGSKARLVTDKNGTTNEEVLEMLIDRMDFLNAKFPSNENITAINHLYSALYALKARTYDRQKRGVEGKPVI